MNGVLILVADADPAFVEFVSQAVAGRGWEVQKAHSGIAALNMLRSWPTAFSLVLAAMELPIVSGPDLLQRMKENGIEVPVILLSETSHPLPPAEGQSQSIVSKAFTPLELQSLLESILMKK